MSRMIWKYPLKVTDQQVIDFPSECPQILCLQMQKGIPTLWVEVNPESVTERWLVHVYGTGHPLDDKMDERGLYIGTFMIESGALVFHVYARRA